VALTRPSQFAGGTLSTYHANNKTGVGLYTTWAHRPTIRSTSPLCIRFQTDLSTAAYRLHVQRSNTILLFRSPIPSHGVLAGKK